MQTFLPYADFQECAKSLDYRRLGKQRVEAYQILKALSDPLNPWRRHSLVRRWSGYQDALILYYNSMVREWISRGYDNNMPLILPEPKDPEMPSFIGVQSFHDDYKRLLISKDPAWYGEIWPELRPAVLPAQTRSTKPARPMIE